MPSPALSSILLLIIAFFSLLVPSSSKIFSQKYNIHSIGRGQGWNYIGRSIIEPGKLELNLAINISFPSNKTTKEYIL